MTEVFRTNVLGVLLTTQAFLPLLQKGRKKQVRPCFSADLYQRPPSGVQVNVA